MMENLIDAAKYNSGQRYRDAFLSEFEEGSTRLVYFTSSGSNYYAFIETPHFVFYDGEYSAAQYDSTWSMIYGYQTIVANGIRLSCTLAEYVNDVMQRSSPAYRKFINETGYPLCVYPFPRQNVSGVWKKLWSTSRARLGTGQKFIDYNDPFNQAGLLYYDNAGLDYPTPIDNGLFRRLLGKTGSVVYSSISEYVEPEPEPAAEEALSTEEVMRQMLLESQEHPEAYGGITGYDGSGYVDTERSESNWPVIPWAYTAYYENIGWYFPNGFALAKGATNQLWQRFSSARQRYALVCLVDYAQVPKSATWLETIVQNTRYFGFNQLIASVGPAGEVAGLVMNNSTRGRVHFVWPLEGNCAFGRAMDQPRLGVDGERQMIRSFLNQTNWYYLIEGYQRNSGGNDAHTVYGTNAPSLNQVWSRFGYKPEMLNISAWASAQY